MEVECGKCGFKSYDGFMLCFDGPLECKLKDEELKDFAKFASSANGWWRHANFLTPEEIQTWDDLIQRILRKRLEMLFDYAHFCKTNMPDFTQFTTSLVNTMLAARRDLMMHGIDIDEEVSALME